MAFFISLKISSLDMVFVHLLFYQMFFRSEESLFVLQKAAPRFIIKQLLEKLSLQ